MRLFFAAFAVTLSFFDAFGQLYNPLNVRDRQSFNNIQLATIGKFGMERKARPGVPAHLHTGVDIKRPGNNYDREPIFAVAKGTVISKRSDGAYAMVMLVHNIGDKRFWSIYEHIAGIEVEVGDEVDPLKPIARFMNKRELDRYGWQFDHFHLEILRVKPVRRVPDRKTPSRYFDSYTLRCFSSRDLTMYFYDPLKFLAAHQGL